MKSSALGEYPTVNWKIKQETHNLKVASYDLFGGLIEDYCLGKQPLR